MRYREGNVFPNRIGAVRIGAFDPSGVRLNDEDDRAERDRQELQSAF
jgi:hypothetical protein